MPIKSLGNTITQPMMDDQKTVMHLAPVDATGAPDTLASTQPVPAFAVSGDPAVTTDSTIDPTGLSCAVIGVKGTASGTATVTATYTNVDGSVATGVAIFTITKDPAESNVASFNVTVDTPVSQ